jgi:ubiquinone/menaquinone biosynthesis C-methylase UbiE
MFDENINNDSIAHSELTPTEEHLRPGTADYEAHVQVEHEHFAKLYDDPDARSSLFYRVPATWDEVEKRAGRLITAASGSDMTGHILHRLNAHDGVRMLSLGSGPGGLECGFAARAPTAEIVCMDFNPKLLELGRTRAASGNLNVTFVQADLNLVELPLVEFDVVFCHAALHHVIELERLVDQIKRTLRKNGVFITVDVVTRNGYQMWPQTRDVVRPLWRTLPEQFRVNHTAYDDPRADEDIWEVNTSADSMECIRSEDILSVLTDRLVNECYVPYFSISRRFFDTMYGPNYDLSQALDSALFEWIWELDRYYLNSQRLPPETFFGIYRLPTE